MKEKELIQKFFNQECSPEELQQLYTLLENGFPEGVDVRIFEEFLDARSTPKKEMDASKVINQVLSQIEQQKPRSIEKPPGILVFNRRFIAVAASILLLFTIGYFLTYKLMQSDQPTANRLVWQELTTQKGERKNIELSDGSKVILNKQSYLRYPKEFNKITREVYLEGEAYFQIAHDSGHPFVVRTEKASTLVLGTQFNVKAIKEDSLISVSLVKGSVEVNIDQVASLEPVLLKPNQGLTYNKNQEEISTQEFDIISVVGWKDNVFTFKKDKLTEICCQISDHFGIDIHFASEKLKRYESRGVFKGETAEEVLKAVFAAAEDCLEVTNTDNGLFIQKGNCKN